MVEEKTCKSERFTRAFSAVARYSTLIVSLINMRLLVNALGLEAYAAYAIVLSLSGWLILLNLGLPNQVQNKLSEGRQSGKEPKTILRPAFAAALLSFIASIPLMGILSYLAPKKLLPFASVFSFGALWSFLSLCSLTAFTSLANQALIGQRKTFWPNISGTVAALSTTGLLWLILASQIKNPDCVLILSVVPQAGVLCISLLMLGNSATPEFNWRRIFQIIYESRKMQLFSLLTLVVLAVDYIVIARILSPKEIVQYNIEMRVFGGLLVGYAAVLGNSWTPFLDKVHQGDTPAALVIIRNTLKFGFVIGIGGGMLALLANKYMVTYLSGSKVTGLPATVLLLFVFYVIVRIWSDTFSVVLLALEKTNIILVSISCQAVINVVFQLILTPRLGAGGTVLALIISFTLTSVWIYPVYAFKAVAFKGGLAGCMRAENPPTLA